MIRWALGIAGTMQQHGAYLGDNSGSGSGIKAEQNAKYPGLCSTCDGSSREPDGLLPAATAPLCTGCAAPTVPCQQIPSLPEIACGGPETASMRVGLMGRSSRC